uniref:Uncharacterized protein n=1 Tax=Strigamia maritima TaxID=126957 RepID=T1JGZ8_STRMM
MIPLNPVPAVPGAPPQDVRGEAVDSRSLRVHWQPPPSELQNGDITYYKVKYVEAAGSASKTRHVTTDAAQRSYVLDGLERWTEYRIELLAGTVVGDGPASQPTFVRTSEDVPGDPRRVKVSVINSTTIRVEWKAPMENDANGIIRGYQIHVQEMNDQGDLVNEPLRFDVVDGTAEEFNISGLQPDTTYSVQVSAYTRKGDGTRSRSKTVSTPGGVPNRPLVTLRIVQEEPSVTLDMEWVKPSQTYGPFLGYRLRYGKKDGAKKEIELGGDAHNKRLEHLEKGTVYEIRVAGRNNIGYGQEAIEYVKTPAGVPSGAPENLTFWFQTPTTVAFAWQPPLANRSNGDIVLYQVQFHKRTDFDLSSEKNTTETKMVFDNLEEDSDYVLRVKAFTSKGGGPYGERVGIRTPTSPAPAPLWVKSMATSDYTAHVWWESVPSDTPDVTGYRVYYTTTPVEDMDRWLRKDIALTDSCELTNMEPKSQYAVVVAARTSSHTVGRVSETAVVKMSPDEVVSSLQAHSVSTHSMMLAWKHPPRMEPLKYRIAYGAIKEYVDTDLKSQKQTIPIKVMYVDSETYSQSVHDLLPFTSYRVNVTAVPQDESYRPPVHITVTTAMAAPQPMVKPDFFGVQNDAEISVILPRASEEFGPISHYYLVVVPDEKANKNPDQFTLEELTTSPKPPSDHPYIAAKFIQRSITRSFVLGDGKTYDGFVNRRLEAGKKYRIFVRAVVDTPQKNLYTSSPFSNTLSLDMSPVATGGKRPEGGGVVSGGGGGVSGGGGGGGGAGGGISGGASGDNTGKPGIAQVESAESGDVLWIIAPIVMILILGAVCALIVLMLLKKRRQTQKAPDHSGVTKPLMSDFPAHPSDPVEMRRLNFQTPAMISHPPIPISELGAHIDRLKANDNLKFSQEYESIEPGQQFMWDNSNAEVNKAKNRYANVIAYDHSRVVLQPIEGVAGSDYVNANLCDGYRKQNAYVATQGPLPETFGDFWRMMWEQRSATIVMMTKLEERTRIKCDQYWPGRGTETYGLVHVSLVDVQELATYCIRTFHLQRLGYAEKREVRQFQFTAWPDHGVPDHPTPFLTFLRRVKSVNPPDAGPIVVHCSAGVGRTGAFIVIDSMLERIKHEKTVDIYGHVTCLRAQRNYMVQTEDQYIFIHDALFEAVVCGVSEVAARNLYAHIQKLSQVEVGETSTGMELEFKRLATLKVQSSKFVSANLPCNKHKNRLEKCHQYWPSERSARYQYFVVDPIAEYNMPQYILREFKVTDARDGQSRTIRQFQYTDWPEQGVPKSGEGFIDFIGQVHKTKEQFGQDGPITVHCSAGVGRTGVFITLSIVLERMQYEGVVDMFQTVRMLRTQRPAMVQSEDQFQFSYRAALEYLGSFDHYAN